MFPGILWDPVIVIIFSCKDKAEIQREINWIGGIEILMIPELYSCPLSSIHNPAVWCKDMFC